MPKSLWRQQDVRRQGGGVRSSRQRSVVSPAEARHLLAALCVCVSTPWCAPRRYLLKLRAEVEVMQQLGLSLNAVHLHDVFEVGGAGGAPAAAGQAHGCRGEGGEVGWEATGAWCRG